MALINTHYTQKAATEWVTDWTDWLSWMVVARRLSLVIEQSLILFHKLSFLIFDRSKQSVIPIQFYFMHLWVIEQVIIFKEEAI